MAILGSCARQSHNEHHEKSTYCVDWVASPTLKQWMIDMTGPEDAWAREQYAALVEGAKAHLDTGSEDTWSDLRKALKAAGEIP